MKSKAPPAGIRLAWIYASHLPPAWCLDALLAHCYVSLGMVQTALDIFLSLGHWEEIVACYNYLKLRHKVREDQYIYHKVTKVSLLSRIVSFVELLLTQSILRLYTTFTVEVFIIVFYNFLQQYLT